MEFGQNLRAASLAPLLKALDKVGVSPDHITIASGICGALFFPLWLFNQSIAAFIALLLHVLLDGLDGPLARFQRVASPRGSFVDTFTDQVVVTLVMIAHLIRDPGSLNIAFGGLYIFLYAIVVAMAMIRNALSVPYSWLVRPRFFIFASMFVEWLSGWAAVLVVLVICDVLLTIKCISGFIALRSKIPGPRVDA